MNQLMLEGINLMLVGMGAVFVFLTLLVFTTSLMSRVVAKYAPPKVMPNAAMPVNTPQPAQLDPAADSQLLAVISAAIHCHRSRHK